MELSVYLSIVGICISIILFVVEHFLINKPWVKKAAYICLAVSILVLLLSTFKYCTSNKTNSAQSETSQQNVITQTSVYDDVFSTERPTASENPITLVEHTTDADNKTSLTSTTQDQTFNIIVDRLLQYKNDQMYEEGIKYIHNLSNNYLTNKEIIEYLNQFVDSYRTDILNDAAKAFDEFGYEEAIEILEASTSVIPDDVEIQQRISDYKTFVPVSLKKLTVTDKGDYYFASTAFDPREQLYTDVLYLYSSSENWIPYKGMVEFYLGKIYSSFSCSIVPEKDFTTEKNAGSLIKIFKDDSLIYTSDLITYKTQEIQVNLDIRNTDYLKIIVENINPNHNYMAHADTLICEGFVQK